MSLAHFCREGKCGLILTSFLARIARSRSDATGDRSWSLILVRVFTEKPWVPSKRTRAETSPGGVVLSVVPRDATMRFSY